MIYVHDNKIHYYGDFPISYKMFLASEQHIAWHAKLKNKYWNKDLYANVKVKITLYEEEINRLQQETNNEEENNKEEI